MNRRATPQAMRLRRSTVEHPFGTLKYRIFGHPRFLLRGIAGAQAEISLATIAYNLKRMINVLGGAKLAAACKVKHTPPASSHLKKQTDFSGQQTLARP